MPHINLLPWRETLRKEREFRFVIIIGVSLAFAGLVVLLVHLYMNNEHDYQQRRNDYLNTQIKQATAKIMEIKKLKENRKRLVKRMEVIQRLEGSRPNVVHLFDELVKRVPNGVYFTNLKQTDNKIRLSGVAQSDARVSSLMGNLEASPWLTDPKIYSIRAKGDRGQKANYKTRNLSTFNLEITQTTPKKGNSK